MVHDPLLNIKITSVVCSFFALLATGFRLYLRRGRYWWDDGWAFFSLICLLVQVAGVFMHVPNPAELSKTNRVAAYYIIAVAFYLIIWPARLSILYSVIRIETHPAKRRNLYYISVLFILTTLALISQLFWVCEPNPKWKDKASPQCPLTKQVAICQLVSDIISDLILIIAPLSLIRELMDVALRRRLTLIFSTSIITTIVSLVHAAYILREGGPKVLVAAFVENTASLIVCNLPVVAAAAFRLQSTTGSEDAKHVSTIHFSRSRSRYTSRRTNNTNTIDITTTIAMSEFNDERTGTIPPYTEKVTDATSYPDRPPGIPIFHYPQRSDNHWGEAPDTGTAFQSYFTDNDASKAEQGRPTKSAGRLGELTSRVEFSLPLKHPHESRSSPLRNDREEWDGDSA